MPQKTSREIQEEIYGAVDTISDNVIAITKTLHTVIDNLSTRHEIYQQVGPDYVSKKIGQEDIKEIFTD